MRKLTIAVVSLCMVPLYGLGARDVYSEAGFAAVSAYRNCINASFRSRVYLTLAHSLATKPPAGIAEDAFLDCGREEEMLKSISKPEELHMITEYKVWAKQWFIQHMMAAELPAPPR
jgi:hypothetical protein